MWSFIYLMCQLPTDILNIIFRHFLSIPLCHLFCHIDELTPRQFQECLAVLIQLDDFQNMVTQYNLGMLIEENARYGERIWYYFAEEKYGYHHYGYGRNYTDQLRPHKPYKYLRQIDLSVTDVKFTPIEMKWMRRVLDNIDSEQVKDIYDRHIGNQKYIKEEEDIDFVWDNGQYKPYMTASLKTYIILVRDCVTFPLIPENKDSCCIVKFNKYGDPDMVHPALLEGISNANQKIHNKPWKFEGEFTSGYTIIVKSNQYEKPLYLLEQEYLGENICDQIDWLRRGALANLIHRHRENYRDTLPPTFDPGFYQKPKKSQKQRWTQCPRKFNNTRSKSHRGRKQGRSHTRQNKDFCLC